MIVLAFSLVLVAGFFQGTFVLPMTMTKKWEWEHTWGTFSLLGMLIFNWILAFIFIPNTLSIYGSVPSRDIIILILFGAGWGVGAILFGLGMDKLGMALGYPIIMGLIASLGALIPLVIFFPETLLKAKGLMLLSGTTLAIVGIIFCSRGGARKQPEETNREGIRSGAFAVGLSIAIFAGILSCFPNVGMAFGENMIDAARELGISDTFAGNTVWALFFTVGFIVNCIYCLYLMIRRNSLKEYFNPESLRNVGLCALMSLLWIGSFYLYGMSAAKLGKWGVIVGWPLFICLSIVVGNLWGIWRGEWKGAPPRARTLLNTGILILLVAVVVIAVSNSFQ
jgi:L-rhamnose-H+ transport protein